MSRSPQDGDVTSGCSSPVVPEPRRGPSCCIGRIQLKGDVEEALVCQEWAGPGSRGVRGGDQWASHHPGWDAASLGRGLPAAGPVCQRRAGCQAGELFPEDWPRFAQLSNGQAIALPGQQLLLAKKFRLLDQYASAAQVAKSVSFLARAGSTLLAWVCTADKSSL